MTKRVKKAVNKTKSRWRRFLPASGILFQYLMFTLVVGIGIGGVLWLWTSAAKDPRFRMDGETLALAGAVRECPESVTELETIGRRFAGRSLFDPILVSDMERAYSQSSWVKKITKMRRRFPNRMEVEFLLRVPAAQVWHEKRFWLIDIEGMLLPVPGASTRYSGLPEIVGATSRVIGKRPATGSHWADEGIDGALGVLRAIWGSPLAEFIPIERVVVVAESIGSAKNVARRRFEIVAESGAVIRWGTYNHGDLSGELTSSEKLWQLQELLRREEALRPDVNFDIRTRLPGYSL